MLFALDHVTAHFRNLLALADFRPRLGSPAASAGVARLYVVADVLHDRAPDLGRYKYGRCRSALQSQLPSASERWGWRSHP